MEITKEILCVYYGYEKLIICLNNKDIEICDFDDLHKYVNCSDNLEKIKEELLTNGYYIKYYIKGLKPLYNDTIDRYIVYAEYEDTYDTICIYSNGNITSPNYNKEYLLSNCEDYNLDMNLDYIDNL